MSIGSGSAGRGLGAKTVYNHRSYKVKVPKMLKGKQNETLDPEQIEYNKKASGW
jgi:hypothetical protein